MTSTIKEHLIAAHTPGPWQGCLHLRDQADATCGCGYRGGIWSTTSDTMICEMGAGTGPGADMIPVGDRATQIADHWLITSAPDLLDALRSIPNRDDQANAEGFSEAMDDWWKETAMPAIAKAEGRHS